MFSICMLYFNLCIRVSSDHHGIFQYWNNSDTHEESYSAANSIGRKFLYNSRDLDVIILLLKY